MSKCTTTDNMPLLNATKMVQLSMKPLVRLQLIREEQHDMNSVGFILPTVQTHS